MGKGGMTGTKPGIDEHFKASWAASGVSVIYMRPRDWMDDGMVS